MKTGSLVKLLRTADGVSQTELAVQLGIARTYLSQVENNRVEPGMPFLKSVSRRFSVPVSLLVIEHTEQDGEIISELQRLLGHLLSARLALKRT